MYKQNLLPVLLAFTLQTTLGLAASPTYLERSRFSTGSNFQVDIDADTRWGYREFNTKQASEKILNFEEISDLARSDTLGAFGLFYANSPTFEGRLNAFQVNMKTIGFLVEHKPLVENLDMWLRQISAQNHNLKASLPEVKRLFLDGPMIIANQRARKARRLWGPFAGLVGPSRNYEAMRRVNFIMSPRQLSSASLTTFSLPSLWVESSQDPEFVAGSAEATRIVLGRLHEVLNGKKVNSDVFTDVINGFLAVNPNGTVARERAFKLLGLYGTRGPNLFALIGKDKEVSPPIIRDLAKSISILGSVLPALDAKSVEQGMLYSMPKEILGGIDYSRSYHFWMSAYLSDRLKGEGYSQQTAFQAVNRWNILYEAFAENLSTTANRTNPLTFNESKKDILFGAAGSAWGSTASKVDIEKIYDVQSSDLLERALTRQTFSSGEKTIWKSYVLDKLETIKPWLEHTAPFSIENEVRRQARFPALERIYFSGVGPLISEVKSASKSILTRNVSCPLGTIQKFFFYNKK